MQFGYAGIYNLVLQEYIPSTQNMLGLKILRSDHFFHRDPALLLFFQKTNKQKTKHKKHHTTTHTQKKWHFTDNVGEKEQRSKEIEFCL